MQYKRLRPTQILLDSQNPRLPDGTSSDKEAINRLLAEGSSQLLALARDLVDRGEGNPSELPIVEKLDSKFVVLEGNRRFAALKLIHNPRLANDEVMRAAFEKLNKREDEAPKTLMCALAKDRAEADPWITLRHTGANEGVGVRVWSPDQSARHRVRMKAPIDSGTVRSIAIADELTEAYQTDTYLTGLIETVRSGKLTNIGRLFSSDTLTRMHFVLKQSGDVAPATLWARHTANQLHDFFVWAFELLNAESVDTFKNETLRGALLTDNAGKLPDGSAAMAEHFRLADRPYGSGPRQAEPDGAEGDGSQAGPDEDKESTTDSSTSGQTEAPGSGNGSPAPSGSRKQDKKPERYLYSDVKLTNISPNIQRLLKEARQLVIDDSYASACVLARVILELTVSDPVVLKWSGKKEASPLTTKIQGCILKLDPDIDSIQKRTRQDLVQAHLETKEVGVMYLHQFMHNPHAKADPHLARRFSAAFAPLLNGINEAVQ